MQRWVRSGLRMAASVVLVVLAAGTAQVVRADAPAAGNEQALLAAESERFADQVSHDATALARELADDLVYAHVSGMHQSKAEYLHAVQSGGIPYKSIEASARSARVIGEVGITRGVLKMVVGDAEKFSTYLGVYVHRDGRWQLLEWQSAPDPAHPEGPAH